MRIGVDGTTIPDVEGRGPLATLRFAKEQGLDGVFFRMILDISPTLDLGELREAKELASELRLYLECGVGRVNPFNIPESPRIAALGDGNYRLAMERMIRAARSIDCVELGVVVATSENKSYSGYHSNDRFRTDVEWNDQLSATEKFLKSLAPILRDQACRLNIETHDEITSVEVVRLVEAVGSDTTGVTFNTAEVVSRGENPISAARRVAPYTHLTRVNDCSLYFGEHGLVRQMKPCGQGIIDWEVILPILWEQSPSLNLSLEDYKGMIALQIYDPDWRGHQPDLDLGEVLNLVRLAAECEKRIIKGEIPDPTAYEAIPYQAQKLERMQGSVACLRKVIQSRRLQDTRVGPMPNLPPK